MEVPEAVLEVAPGAALAEPVEAPGSAVAVPPASAAEWARVAWVAAGASALEVAALAVGSAGG